MLNLITALAMVIVTTLLIGWDIWVVTHGGKTISNYMMNVGREFMTAPFAWGMLGGHFFAFHFRNFDSSGQIWRSLTLAGAGIVILLWDVWMQFHPFPAGSSSPLAALSVCVVPHWDCCGVGTLSADIGL